MIYHIALYDDYIKFLEEDYFEEPSLKLEGFIHCSTKDQVYATLQRYYASHETVLLMHINENKLEHPLKYELAPSVNQDFPHIYGPLNKSAIEKLQKIKVADEEKKITKSIK